MWVLQSHSRYLQGPCLDVLFVHLSTSLVRVPRDSYFPGLLVVFLITPLLPTKMLVALCLNKVSCFIMPQYKIYTMYSIWKHCQCVFITQSKINQASALQLIYSCYVYQLSKKYCVYYVSEHLKYCSKINEYWLNK